jgi:hypothetical protein
MKSTNSTQQKSGKTTSTKAEAVHPGIMDSSTCAA